MDIANKTPLVESLVSPLFDCLTEESARRLLDLKPDPALQSRVDEMASRHTEGLLSDKEKADYGQYVSYATFIAILKSKARRMLAGG